MPAHKYPRRRPKHGRALGATPFRAPVARVRGESVALTENANAAKRGAASMDYQGRADAMVAKSRREYAPLTVSTPIRRARIAPKTTSYTI